MKPDLSVIICTHNPRRDYLDQVLAALQQQTLQIDQWELLLIDNASDRVLSTEIDLSWHPQARHIREKELGLTPARLRGIQESQAELLIFVDDDNVLDSDYLEVALSLAEQLPMLGVWWGQSIPAFDVPPPAWTKQYWKYLAIEEFKQDFWGNFFHANTAPRGAGMCVRRTIAQGYLEFVNKQPVRRLLDRKGTSLVSGGDTDIAYTACELGLGIGKFHALKLTHLIPQSRLQEDYLLKLYEAMHYTSILRQIASGFPARRSWRSRTFQYCRRWFMKPQSRRFHDAGLRGTYAALKDFA